MMTIPHELPEDVEALKAIIAAYENEKNELRELTESLNNEKKHLIGENFYLQEKIRQLTAKLFGKKSEKLTAEDVFQGRLFDEAEEGSNEETVHRPAPTIRVASHERKKPGRKPLPDYLPREEIVIDIPEEEKRCACGEERTKIGEDVCEKMDIIPAKVVVKKYIRPKYACRNCEGSGDEGKIGVLTAPLPPQVLPRSIATPGLLAYLFTSKFCDALPFYRQEKMFARIGVDLSRATMCNLAMDIREKYPYLESSMWEGLREYPSIGIDETTVQVLAETGKKNTTTSYMWLFRGAHKRPLVLYHYAPSRSPNEITCFLEGYSGVIQTDGYAGYDIFGKSVNIRHAGCWAHARRKFYDAEKASPGGYSAAVLGTIKELYAVEDEARERVLSPDEVYSLRREKSLPVIERLKSQLESKAHHVAPKSLLGKAIRYTLDQWNKLCVYLDDGQIPIDNNAVENAIRPFVVGRKNWLFSGSPRGARASALLYSIIETAKANRFEPYWYFRFLFERLPVTPKEEISSILPHRLDPVIFKEYVSGSGKN